MKDLSLIFSSQSKYRILRTLFSHHAPIHLRALAELSGIHIRSAQLALKSLCAVKVLARSAEGNKLVFSLNKRSKYYEDVVAHFREEKSRELRARSKSYALPPSFLQQLHELRMLSWSVRG